MSAKNAKCQNREKKKKKTEMCPLLAARIRREKRRAEETPEQTAARRAKSAEISRQRRAKLAASETPEQAQARRSRALESAARNRKELQAKETPEQRTARLHERAAKLKRYRENKLEKLKAEYKEQYLEKIEELKKIRKAKLRASETPEQTKARLRESARKLKRYRENKVEELKAEYKELYLDKLEELKKIRKAKLLASETPEQTKARLLRHSQKTSRLRRERHANETPEERNARLLREREYNRNYRLKRKQMRREMYNELKLKGATQKGTKIIKSKFPMHKSIDDDTIESCTLSSCGPSEESFTLTTTDGGSSITSSDEFRSDKSIIVKNEPLSWFESDDFETNSMSQAHRNTEIPLVKGQYSDYQLPASYMYSQRGKSKTDNTVSGRDEHSEYSVYVADRFRKCNRNKFEINVAMKLVDDVMFNLSIGRYSLECSGETNAVDQKEKAPSLSTPHIIRTIVQDIIVKEELDL